MKAMKVRSPYDPPGTDAGAAGAKLSRSDWNRAARVFVGWTVASALLGGAADAMRIGYALQTFGAEYRTVGIVAVGALRTGGARVVVTAATIALVVAIHRRSVPSGPVATTSRHWPMLLALPITAPVAACLIVGAAFAVASFAFGIPFRASWTSTVGFVRLVDPLFGVLAASISAALLGAAIPTAIRFMVATRRGLPIKIAAALLASLALNTLVGATLDATSPAADAVLPSLEAQVNLSRRSSESRGRLNPALGINAAPVPGGASVGLHVSF